MQRLINRRRDTLPRQRLFSPIPGAIMIKKAWAVWKGGIKDGGGTISTETGMLREAPYGFKARFENGKVRIRRS
jgi:hypothetical protein